MRYKVIYFYLPTYKSPKLIGSSIQHFTLTHEPYVYSSSEEPGSEYSGPAKTYGRLGNTNIYRAYNATTSPSSFYVKIIAESDPLFNIDYAFWLGTDEELGKHIGTDIYNPIIVPIIVGDGILNTLTQE